MKKLEKKRYISLNCIDNDTDICEEIVSDYDGSSYIGDAIASVADSNVNICNRVLWETAPSISEYIEEAISERLVDTSSNKIDLTKIFQAGEYVYYTRVLYKNLTEIIFNYAVDYIERNHSNVTIDEEDQLEEKLSSIDDNSTFDDIESAVDELVDELQEDEEEEIED